MTSHDLLPFVLHVIVLVAQLASAVWFMLFTVESRRRWFWRFAALLYLGVTSWHVWLSVPRLLSTRTWSLDIAHDLLQPVTMLVLLVGIAQIRPVFRSLLDAQREAQYESDLRHRYLQTVRNVVVSGDLAGRLTLINRAGQELLGVREEDVLGASWLDAYCVPEQRDEVRAGFRAFLADEYRESEEVEYDVRTSDGRVRTIQWQRTKVRDDEGAVIGILSSGEDVSDRLQAERESEFKAYLLDSATESIIVVDEHFRYRYANEAACRLRGYGREELLGLSPEQLFAAEHVSVLKEMVSRAWREGHGSADLDYLHKDGSRIPVHLNVKLIRYHGEQVLLSVGRDLREQKQAEERIEQLMGHDVLTGLANRALFQASLAEQMAEAGMVGRRVSVFYLNVDHFRSVNDSLGRDAGDTLLQLVATRLIGVVGKDDRVARMGGDEFAFMTLADSESQARLVLRRVRAVLGEPIVLGRQPVRLSVSMGVAVASLGSETAADLIRQADLAMHHSKARGRDDHAFYASNMDIDSLERFALQNDLRSALEHEEFELHYQPQARLSDGSLMGVEALLRWRHPQRGMVAPGEFIPLAEDSGIIVPLGEWVLRQACRQAREWRSAGLPAMRMAVNVSLKQALHPSLPGLVRDVLAETGLEPDLLELELTESTVMTDADRLSSVMHELRGLGVRLAIDDFGTGHSSLERLRALPICTLKIDRSFVSDICTNEDAAAIATTILNLARSLRLSVIAEGIEADCQAEHLRSLGCDEMQGYFLSRPLPADALGEFLASYAPGVASREHPRELEVAE